MGATFGAVLGLAVGVAISPVPIKVLIVVMLSFVVIASLTVATPVILNLILGSRAGATLTSMKQWLTANNNTVMSVLFVVLGANVLGNGLAILA